MGISRCSACAAIRPPNARFCPQCGSAFDIRDTPAPPGSAVFPRDIEVGMSFWTSIKIGIGITIGSAIVGLIGFVLYLLLVGSILSGLAR